MLKGLVESTEKRASPAVQSSSATGHEARLAKTLRVSAQLLEEYTELEAALDLLAWSASASMGWSLLEHLVAPANSLSLREGLDAAVELRVLRREGEADGEPRFRMHRLVQEVRRSERPIALHVDRARAMVGRLAAWFEARRRDFKDLVSFEAELDHLQRWVEEAVKLGMVEAEVRLRWLRAYPDWHRGVYGRSLAEIDHALGRYAEAGMKDRELEAHLRADRGVVLDALGRYREALADAESALSIRREILGEDHSDTALSYGNTGGEYLTLEEYEKALLYVQRELDIRTGRPGEPDSDTARAYQRLAGVHQALSCRVGGHWSIQESYMKALECAERALLIRQKVLGGRHPDTASSFDELGKVNRLTQRSADADECLLQALEIRESIFGEFHPETATSLRNICFFNIYEKKYDIALKYGKRALETQVQVLTSCHPHTADVHNSIGVILCDTNKFKDALPHFRAALMILSGLLPVGHSKVLIACGNMLS
jgi:tetratricopeptide (TPR) repeat protein